MKCENCGKQLRSDNSTGFCSPCRPNRYKNDRYARGRTCSVCGGPLMDKSVTGVCSKTEQCRKTVGVLHSQRDRKDRKGATALLAPAYDLDTDEEIVDEVAIEVMVAGNRRVDSTLRERQAATEKMIKIGLGPQEVAEHIGTTVAKLGPVVEPLGYVIIPRGQRGPKGKQTSKAAVFAKVGSVR